jgi:hypothetical protein
MSVFKGPGFIEKMRMPWAMASLADTRVRASKAALDAV